jgi:hypothetical protein
MSSIDNLLRNLRVGSDRSKTTTPASAEKEATAGVIDRGEPAAPAMERPKPSSPRTHLEETLQALTSGRREPAVASPPAAPAPRRDEDAFEPAAPRTLEEAGLTESDVSGLILKFLLPRGVESGYRISNQIGLRFNIADQVLRQLKQDKLLTYKNTLNGGDYLYELTDLGRERGDRISHQTTYCGTAPVPLNQYVASVKAQSIAGRRPPIAAIRLAFGDMNLSEPLLQNVGQAIHSGRGMFLYGPPGNGKTSIAERITKSFGDYIWIPRAIHCSGEIIRLFDPNRHKVAPELHPDIMKEIDGRWIRVERPTIIAGGELRMDNLEITYIRNTSIGEAPLQMKSNCGTLLIDDFGRQRMPVDELLNRWIVPLEQRHDYLQLESGRSIQVPFDQLIVFSSNMEPKDLVDDAFLRRIPYKIEVQDPTESEFRKLFHQLADEMRFHCDPHELDYLVNTHYRAKNVRFRFCHPRDILRQLENRCTLLELPRTVTREGLDQAIQNYFSIMLGG